MIALVRRAAALMVLGPLGTLVGSASLLGCGDPGHIGDVPEAIAGPVGAQVSSSSGGPAGAGGSGGADATGSGGGGAPGEEDDAEIVSATFPAGLTCGAANVASVTVRNIGLATWSHAAGYALGAVDDHDDLHAEYPRVWFDDSVSVPPGGTHTFEITIAGPANPGDFVSDWRMVHELVQWFGATAAATVGVQCNRTPDPAPGEVLPLPDMAYIVQEIHDENPGLIEQTCQDEGGNWGFMDAVVDRLREHDTRWGYNWKRGEVGNPSQDAIDYHYGAGPDEDSTDVYIIDMIGGHCGPTPSPAWIDQTQATLDGGTIGRWTGRGRF
jgi:hypothetical protein